MEQMPQKFTAKASETLGFLFLGLLFVVIVSGAFVLTAAQQASTEPARIASVYAFQN